MKSEKEIELKLEVKDVVSLKQKLEALGATFISTKQQEDVLFLHDFIDFKAADQALRLRTETDDSGSESQLAFKGTPTHTADGHKVRDEFETEVADPEMTKKILESIGLKAAFVITKERTSYHLDEIEVAIDSLKFGDYVELEGQAEAIEQLRGKLDLQDAEPVTRGYIFMQWDWEKEHEGKEIPM